MAPVYALDLSLVQRLHGIKYSYEVMSERIAALSNAGGSNADDRSMLVSLLKERSELDRVVTPFSKYLDLERQLNDSHVMEATLTSSIGQQHRSASAGSEDAELLEMLRQDRELMMESIRTLEDMIMASLVPRDPLDDRGVMLELRQGTGGSEACLFARDLLDSYTRYAAIQGWKCERVSETIGEGGGQWCYLQGCVD
jgi:peptide chain release factor 1